LHRVPLQKLPINPHIITAPQVPSPEEVARIQKRDSEFLGKLEQVSKSVHIDNIAAQEDPVFAQLREWQMDSVRTGRFGLSVAQLPGPIKDEWGREHHIHIVSGGVPAMGFPPDDDETDQASIVAAGIAALGRGEMMSTRGPARLNIAPPSIELPSRRWTARPDAPRIKPGRLNVLQLLELYTRFYGLHSPAASTAELAEACGLAEDTISTLVTYYRVPLVYEDEHKQAIGVWTVPDGVHGRVVMMGEFIIQKKKEQDARRAQMEKEEEKRRVVFAKVMDDVPTMDSLPSGIVHTKPSPRQPFKDEQLHRRFEALVSKESDAKQPPSSSSSSSSSS